jgi:hypothetical protein
LSSSVLSCYVMYNNCRAQLEVSITTDEKFCHGRLRK